MQRFEELVGPTGVARWGGELAAIHWIVWSLLLLSTAQAAPKLVVLEAVGPQGTSIEQGMHWTDTVRGAVRAALPPKLIVLTRENIEAFLPPGVTLADCEAECEISAGRKIGAEYVVGVRVIQTSTDWKLTVALHATIDGRFLGQGQVSVQHAEIDTGLQTAARQAVAVLAPRPLAADPIVGSGAAPIEMPVLPIIWMGAPIVRLTSELDVPLTIHADGRRVGTTPVNLLLDGRTAITVTATAPEHQPRTFLITTGGASGEATLRLPTSLATIHLKVPFEDVTVHVDGRLLEGRDHTVEAGQHRIEVRHPCLQSEPFVATLTAADSVELDVPHTLTCGNYRIESPTPGAQVRIEEVWHALPFESPIEEGATTSVVVRAPGHHEKKINVTHAPVGTQVYTLPLEPDPVDVHVDVYRWNGDVCRVPVLVDGSEIGVSPWRGTILAGQHTITARCGGPLTRTATLRSGVGPVSIRMAKKGDLGELVISTTRFNSTLMTTRYWSGTHRRGALRASIGMSLGGFGWRDRPAGGFGIELGVGLPVTDWLELGASATGLVGTRKCAASESMNRGEDDCWHQYGEARALVRVYVGRLVVEGGWGVTGQNYWEEGHSGHGLYLGIGGTLRPTKSKRRRRR